MCIMCVLAKQLATLEQMKARLEIEGLRDSDTYQLVLNEIIEVKQQLDTKEQMLNDLRDLISESLSSESLFQPLYKPEEGEKN